MIPSTIIDHHNDENENVSVAAEGEKDKSSPKVKWTTEMDLIFVKAVRDNNAWQKETSKNCLKMPEKFALQLLKALVLISWTLSDSQNLFISK